MDVTPSRVVSFALQAEETMSDDEILIDNRQHGMRSRETDRSEIVAGMEVGLESGYSKQTMWNRARQEMMASIK